MDTHNSFAQRLLRRASLSRNRDSVEVQKSSKQVLQRRYNILKAIEEPLVKEIIPDDNNNESSCASKRILQDTFALSSFSEVPIMESTRKFALSDSTEILLTPHSMFTVSAMSALVEPSEQADGSGKIIASVQSGSEVYDADYFLKNALGDELNNSSVTYDNPSGFDASNSDFDASDLISELEFSGKKRDEEISASSMNPMHPRSSSTLNSTMNLKLSAWEKMQKTRSQRFPKLRAFCRFIRRFLQNLKNVVGLGTFSGT